jgi:2-octaprenyl-6-methoxyphenol hydroxylase
VANKVCPVDIMIVGGGLIGATMLQALSPLGFSCLLVEAKPFSSKVSADFDARSLALAPASVNILKMTDLWSLLESYVTPIDMIHISLQGAFGRARLCGEEHLPLGFVVEMQYIYRALGLRLDKRHLLAPAELLTLDSVTGRAVIKDTDGERVVEARLIIAADGADSRLRHLCGLKASIREYEHQALIANIGLARPHLGQAFERFTSSGPLALLPLTDNRASLVWSMPPSEGARLVSTSESYFLNSLQKAFGYRLGRFVKVGRRVLYPLRQIIMPQQVKDRVIFVGNAAHTLHPVAGQGFNLGLRDVAMLAQCIAKQGLGPEMLNSYQLARVYDQKAITWFTNGLIDFSTFQLPGFSLLRGAGLIAFDHLAVAKGLVARYARGFAGTPPDLACQIPLEVWEHE